MRPIRLPGAAAAGRSAAGRVPVVSAAPEPATEPEPEPLLEVNAAIARVPEALRQQMEELLRAHFRQVQRWSPPVEPVSVRRGSAVEPAAVFDETVEPA